MYTEVEASDIVETQAEAEVRRALMEWQGQKGEKGVKG